MLKKIRVVISLLIFSLLSFYFIDFSGILPHSIHAIGRVQFIPAILSRNVAIVVSIALCVLLFGRVYCSFICPMGFFQDIAIRCSKGRQKTYRKDNPALRLSVLAVSLIPFFSGFAVLIGILDPYSAYGRIATHIFNPIYTLINNALAYTFNRFGNYALYRREAAVLSVFSLVAALLTFAIIGALAWAKGRFYCNTVCPAGTVLGFFSKLSLFKIRINGDKCVSCGVCEKRCKATCIDSKAKAIDYSRCVNCFNCINSCGKKATSFSMRKNKPALQQPVDSGKRNFLLTGLAAAIAAPAAVARALIDGGKKRRETISPPGSIGADRLQKRCASCHLCVSKCPARALKPAFMEYGIGGMMMPMMSFERGFCNFDCVVCASVCPTGALLPLTVEQKHRLQVGRVVFTPERCVVNTKGTSCGACSEHCPTQAVKMVAHKDGLTIPSVDAEICVGCGGCEYICPVRPQTAIYVEGNRVHLRARAFDVEKILEKEITDFGF